MTTIKDILKKYHRKPDPLDLELLIAHEIKNPREFVISHPEYSLDSFKIENLKLKISRRRRGEPLAYILGQKEFYGLAFRVNKDVLAPRPETEMLVDLALKDAQNTKHKILNTAVIDVGTGSGNIIISIAYNMKHTTYNKINFYGIDISSKALNIAKQNAKKHKVDKKIKFLRGDLLDPLLKKLSVAGRESSVIIVANLPYLSSKIYNATAPSVKNYEPKSALYSKQEGLWHYEKLFRQIKKLKKACCLLHATCYLEFSPEQKPLLNKFLKQYFPKAKPAFFKDLADKWRVFEVKI